MRWLISAIVVVILACVVRADDFDDTLAKFVANTAKKTKPIKVVGCRCGCEHDYCSCAAGECEWRNTKAAPKSNFLHDCGCPQLQCNCVGACHCSDNRTENRQPARWDRRDGTWYWVRGNRILGAVNSSGEYYPYDDGVWGKPCKLPAKLPTEQTMAATAAMVCRS